MNRGPDLISISLGRASWLLLALLGSSCTQPRAAAIGYINSPQVMRQYHGTRDRRQTIEAQAQGWQRSLDSLIAAPGAAAGPRRTPQVNQYRAELQQRVLAAGQQADQELMKEVNSFLKSYGKAQGYDFIFGANESGNIVYAAESKDLTAEVVAGLNRAYDQRH